MATDHSQQRILTNFSDMLFNLIMLPSAVEPYCGYWEIYSVKRVCATVLFPSSKLWQQFLKSKYKLIFYGVSEQWKYNCTKQDEQVLIKILTRKKKYLLWLQTTKINIMTLQTYLFHSKFNCIWESQNDKEIRFLKLPRSTIETEILVLPKCINTLADSRTSYHQATSQGRTNYRTEHKMQNRTKL